MNYQIVFGQHSIYQFLSGIAAARVPFTVLFGADGKLSWRMLGYSPQIGVALNSAVQKALAAAPERPAEPIAPEKQTEPIAPEKSAEPIAPEKPEKPVEQATPQKPTEQAAPEKPIERAAPETKGCNCPCCHAPAPEKKSEQGAPEKPEAQ